MLGCAVAHGARRLSTAAAVVGGAALLGAAYASRTAVCALVRMRATARLTGASPWTYYYPGGFESPRMSRREAALVLGVGEYAREAEVRAAHRRVMVANHPDRGGSPYVALKINEAAALLRSAQ